MRSSKHAPSAAIVGVGVDIADVDRFERLLGRGASGVWRHWLTGAEAVQCQQDPHPARAAALRFAVKEATYKSVGAEFADEVRWRDIEVLAAQPHEAEQPHGSGQALWRVALRGEVATAATAVGAERFHVSIHHDDLRVWATVIAEGQDTEADATESRGEPR